jgi:acetyl/propionyl-CoA carboxylase alpha subunit
MGRDPVIELGGRRVAIANRGEIAVRIAATCRRLGAVPVLLLGEPDLEGYAARQVGRVEPVGEAGAELDVDRVIAAARHADADFLHPGYGFLSERAELAAASDAAGIRFVGPSAATLRLCGDKLATRAAAVRAGAPVLPASLPLEDDPAGWLVAARDVGYPLLVKPAGAGGGRGLRRVAEEAALIEAVEASRRESTAAGAGALVYLERELAGARHVEAQVAAAEGRVLILGDRDCSLQRRSQKVIEEAPAPDIDDETRRRLHDHASGIAAEVGLRGIATCEFLVGGDGTLAFLEVNPRIQVEHPVTEAVTGVDLVAWQLAIAAGGALPDAVPPPRGHAIEARVYAEDPAAGFFPAPGQLRTVGWPAGPGLRVDAGYATNDEVPAAYDPMLAKIIAYGADRPTALATLRDALLDTLVTGVPTNVPWLIDLLDNAAMADGRATTGTVGDVPPRSAGAVVADGGPSPPLLAAIAQTLDRSDRRPDDPWAAIGPFRISGPATLTFHGEGWEAQASIRRAGNAWEVTVSGVTVPLRWWRDAAGVWTIAAGERVLRLAIVERDDGIEVAGHGGRWLVHPGPRPTADVAHRERAGDGRVRAPLPGKVLALHAATGDHVARDQPLVTLGAMKMELVSTAPVDGVVERVACQVDQLVTTDDLLVEIRRDEIEPAASS